VVSRSSYAVDLLLAAGCNPYVKHNLSRNTCFIDAMILCYEFESERYDPSNLKYIRTHQILHKFLLWKKYERTTVEFQLPTNNLFNFFDFSRFSVRTFADFYHNVALYDMLYYRSYIEDLKQKFLSSSSS